METMVDRLHDTVAKFAEATYSDGSKILAHVQVGPSANFELVSFPAAYVVAVFSNTLQVTIYIPAKDVVSTEKQMLVVSDGLYEKLGIRGNFQYVQFDGAIYRTITYWV
jgi:hypothetical protein